MNKILLSVAACFISGVAMAEFDIAAHCREVASFGGSHSYSLEKSCRQMEDAAKKRIAKIEDKVPGSILAHCDGVASYGGPGSYSLMESCIKMEMDSKKQLRY